VRRAINGKGKGKCQRIERERVTQDGDSNRAHENLLFQHDDDVGDKWDKETGKGEGERDELQAASKKRRHPGLSGLATAARPRFYGSEPDRRLAYAAFLTKLRPRRLPCVCVCVCGCVYVCVCVCGRQAAPGCDGGS
jgi:hypothetical protein